MIHLFSDFDELVLYSVNCIEQILYIVAKVCIYSFEITFICFNRLNLIGPFI